MRRLCDVVAATGLQLRPCFSVTFITSAQAALAHARTAANAPLPRTGGGRSSDEGSESESGAKEREGAAAGGAGAPGAVCPGGCAAGSCSHSALGPLSLGGSAGASAGRMARGKKGKAKDHVGGAGDVSRAPGAGAQCRSVEQLGVEAFLEHIRGKDGIGSKGQARAPISAFTLFRSSPLALGGPCAVLPASVLIAVCTRTHPRGAGAPHRGASGQAGGVR